MFQSERDVREWLGETGRWLVAESAFLPVGAGLIEHLYAEYERRTGSPLSVTRGRTGSAGPLYAPGVIACLGRGRSLDEQHRIVTRLLDTVMDSGDWIVAFEAVRSEFGELVPPAPDFFIEWETGWWPPPVPARVATHWLRRTLRRLRRHGR